MRTLDQNILVVVLVVVVLSPPALSKEETDYRKRVWMVPVFQWISAVSERLSPKLQILRSLPGFRWLGFIGSKVTSRDTD